MVIDGDLEDTKGVLASYTNYAKGETEVEYKEEEITLDKILEVVKQIGYNPSIE